jgi:hypothetical protein
MRDTEDERKLCKVPAHPLQSCPAFLPRKGWELQLQLAL